MLVIRFLRIGKKNQPVFRIVATDKKNPPRGGRFLEILGFYNPLTKEKQLKADRIKHWLANGAQASDSVHNLLVKEKIIQGKKINAHKKAKKEAKTGQEPKPEEKPAEAQKEKPAEKQEPAKQEKQGIDK